MQYFAAQFVFQLAVDKNAIHFTVFPSLGNNLLVVVETEINRDWNPEYFDGFLGKNKEGNLSLQMHYAFIYLRASSRDVTTINHDWNDYFQVKIIGWRNARQWTRQWRYGWMILETEVVTIIVLFLPPPSPLTLSVYLSIYLSFSSFPIPFLSFIF